MQKAGYLLAVILILSCSCSSAPADRVRQSGEPELVYVQSAQHARVSGTSLILKEVAPQTAYLTGEIERRTGQIPTRDFVELWAGDENPLAGGPNQAQLTCTVDGESITQTLDLADPVLADDELVYRATPPNSSGAPSPLETVICEGPASVFIESVPSEDIPGALFRFDCFRAGMCATLGAAVPKNIYANATRTSTGCSRLVSTAKQWDAGRKWTWYLAPKRQACLRTDVLKYYCTTY